MLRIGGALALVRAKIRGKKMRLEFFRKRLKAESLNSLSGIKFLTEVLFLSCTRPRIVRQRIYATQSRLRESPAKMPKHKLKQALERLKGVDHHLEKQKQLRKAAEKKKRDKEAEQATLEVQEVEEVNGGTNGLVDGEVGESSGEEEGAESGDEEEEEAGVAVSLGQIYLVVIS